MTDKEILEKAADIKNSMKHVQHRFGNGKTECCMTTALFLALGHEGPIGYSELKSSPLAAKATTLLNKVGIEPRSPYFQNEFALCYHNNKQTKQECVNQFRELARNA